MGIRKMQSNATTKPSVDELSAGIRAKLALYQQNSGPAKFTVSESRPEVYIEPQAKKEIPEEEVDWLG